jgi:hypothetical protein
MAVKAEEWTSILRGIGPVRSTQHGLERWRRFGFQQERVLWAVTAARGQRLFGWWRRP